MQKVKAVTDESGHWYLIPNDLFQDFIDHCRYDNEEANEKFESKYGIYRTGGDLNNIQLYAEL